MNRFTQQLLNGLVKMNNNKNVNNMEIIDEERFRELEFNSNTNNLKFIIEHYHRRPKITRYVTVNYQRTPIYEDYTERTRIVKKFDKTINPIKFVNEQIFNLNLNREFTIKIIDEIGIIPPWRQKEIDLENKLKQIRQAKKSFRSYKEEKHQYKFKETNYPEEPSNFWVRLILAPFTLFLSFIGYLSKKQAQINIEENKTNKIWNQKHQKNTDEINKNLNENIKIHNHKTKEIIFYLENEYQQILNKELKIVEIDEQGWIDLRKATNFSQINLKSQKGVYIIRNKTKNKHYVGQTKDIEKRLFNQHFKNGEVKNIIFAKDWYEGDEFDYKYSLCQTKDELDTLEKKCIDEYDAFKNGYNSTSGNK